MGRRWVDAKKEGEAFRKAGREEKEEREIQTQEAARVQVWRAGRSQELQVILCDRRGA